MSQRVIACQVVGEYVTGDGVVIGSAGSHDEVIIELDFSRAGETWEGTTKTVTFTDALGLNPTNILLTANMLVNGTNDVYLVPIPDIIKAVSGRMGMTVSGVIIEGQTEVIRAATELSRFRILPNELVTWEGDDVPASAAEQLQAEIDEFLDDIAHLDDSVAAAAESEANAAASATASAGSAEDAEAWAVGQRNGTDVGSTDETYHNNSKHYAEQAEGSAGASASSATASAGSAVLSESWAVGGTGTRTGENTNNAKYWSDQAQAAAGGGVTSFNGRSGVVTPQSGDYTAAQVGADQSGAAATVQANLNTHDGNTTRHITAAERTAWNGKQDDLTFDQTPTENSGNPVTSGGVFDALEARPRPNLLKNAYFVGGGSQLGNGIFPLNSRGQTSYSGYAIGIDGWYQDLSLTLQANGVVVGNGSTGALIQHFDLVQLSRVLGKTVTASALRADGTLLTGTVTFDSAYNSDTWINYGTSQMQALIFAAGNAQIIRLPTSLSPYVAAKLEFGPTQTLAHQENGVWVLNEIPDFNEELVRCMEGTPSQIETGSYVGTGTHGSSNPNSLTFDFAPKLFCLYGWQSDSSGWVYPFMDTAYRNVMFNPQTHLSTEFTNSRLPSSANQNGTYGKRSADGMTISWYATSADAQNNTTGLIYHYFAIG